MEVQAVLFELLKALCVALFCIAFYVVYKKAVVITNCFYSFLDKNNIKLKEDYKKKILARVVRNQISFKPFNQQAMNNYLVVDILNSKEFKDNVIVKEV